MKIVAKSEIYFDFVKYQKGAVLDMPVHQAEGLICAGCAVLEKDAPRGTQHAKVDAADASLDGPVEDTAVKSPKGKKKGWNK